MSEKKFFQSIHSKTKRDYLSIMNNNKPHYMDVAKKFSKDFFDGERKYGYGGYRYISGWWKKFSQKIITNYNLEDNSNILDIGCGKGFLLYDFKISNPLFQLSGFDISKLYDIFLSKPFIAISAISLIECSSVVATLKLSVIS